MRLNNLCFPGEEILHDLWVNAGKITAIRRSQPGSGPDSSAIDFQGALVFPGLINSHDHLDFNLFPLLGNRTYTNYTEWGPDIHSNNAAAIRKIIQIPQRLRTQWGVYKNLFNGFTTVVNHGPRLVIDQPPISVFQDCYCLHSVGFEPRWKWKLNHPARTGKPFALHVGEGTDAAAAGEIDELIRWNLFRRPLIGIHGVAMTERQARAFRALVWCPASNYFLLDRTAAVDRLLGRVPILFGTDSTLTSGWNAWEQIRMARSLRLIGDAELLAALTTNAVDAWNLNGDGSPSMLRDRGILAPGKIADLVIARPRSWLRGMDAFFALDPEDLLLVMHEGQIRLFDASLAEAIQPIMKGQPQHTRTGGKYVTGDLPGLMQQIRRYCPEVIFPRLPGSHQMTG